MARHHRRSRRARHRFHKRAAPGATPGTVIADPQAAKPVLRLTQYGPDELLEQEFTDLDRLPGLLGKYPVTWLNVDGLGDATIIEKLGRIFGLHPLALEDVVNVHQRPKLEEYSDHLFIVGRMVTLDDRLHTEQISFFLGENFVLTFQERPGDCLDPVRERLRKKGSRNRRWGTGYLVYTLLDVVVDAYFPVVETYGDRLDQLEDRVSTQLAPDVVARMIAEFNYQLKFVIDRLEDIDDVRTYLARFDNIPADRVWLMPQATTPEELREKTDWLKTAARTHGFQFTSRLQIERFGNVRGT